MNAKQIKNFTLKQYTPEHIETCVSLFFDVFTSAPFNFQIPKNNMRRYLTDISNTPGFKGYLYFSGYRLVGLCFGTVLSYFQTTTYDIKEIAITKQLQGEGVGKGFLGEIEKDLDATGVKAITLSTQKTIRAFEFYEKNGFTISEQTVYMSKPL